MIATFTTDKVVPLLKSLVLAACCAGWLHPASAQQPEVGTPLAKPLPDEIVRSSGKWGDRASWRDLGTPNVVVPTPNASAPLQFKTADPAWWGVLDVVGYLAPAVKPAEPSNLGIAGKPYQPLPRVNSPVPPSN
ncbi:hypothetical protein [Herbaspirillum sp. RV1423]|uniref:hypothetical protein n=1 Tax=Herbaspirillum sp. RV1423 TaxID=1443993 RepID=UPI0004AFDA90|nr:hypothetical protein [Herbaspirillum sp. RV1423]